MNLIPMPIRNRLNTQPAFPPKADFTVSFAGRFGVTGEVFRKRLRGSRIINVASPVKMLKSQRKVQLRKPIIIDGINGIKGDCQIYAIVIDFISYTCNLSTTSFFIL